MKFRIKHFVLALVIAASGIVTYETSKSYGIIPSSSLLLSDIEAHTDIWDLWDEIKTYLPQPKKESWVVLEKYEGHVERGQSTSTEVSASSAEEAEAKVSAYAFEGQVSASISGKETWTVSYYTKIESATHSFNVTHRDDDKGHYKTAQQSISEHTFQTGGATDCSRNYEEELNRGCDV